MSTHRTEQIVVRMSASQLERLRAYQRRIGAPTLSAAARAGIEVAMTSSCPPHPGGELPALTTRRGDPDETA